MKVPSLLAGVAGEYFVAAELSRRGYIASISLRNTRGIDILATNQQASRSVTIQCKTNQTNRKVWILNDKCEGFYSDEHFYVFVALGNLAERPNYHIVPSRIVAERISRSHRDWLRTPGRGGREHADSAVRNFSDSKGEFLERWDLLGL
ncbi:MAG: hypothetical protein FD161_44 [Limisphaerales bacterium]|nr:MAG: hypothetical protein FD161_44 [Limisphaerales bacterium]KAG0510490.1 MAG: hypothetical protein E1N63_44 [Limisphaerales bacterium]TXT52763.1 MAG: hypothetical protein FD140_306 [Limisphaerales bacterium]